MCKFEGRKFKRGGERIKVYLLRRLGGGVRRAKGDLFLSKNVDPGLKGVNLVYFNIV